LRKSGRKIEKLEMKITGELYEGEWMVMDLVSDKKRENFKSKRKRKKKSRGWHCWEEEEGAKKLQRIENKKMESWSRRRKWEWG